MSVSHAPLTALTAAQGGAAAGGRSARRKHERDEESARQSPRRSMHVRALLSLRIPAAREVMLQVRPPLEGQSVTIRYDLGRKIHHHL